jgi:hypothetical protein
MTARPTAVLGCVAVAVAVLAVAVRPLLATANTSHSTPQRPAELNVSARVVPVALAAAQRSLACPTSPPGPPGVSCGLLEVARRQAVCPTATRCRVQLIGAVHTRTLDVPVALTVTLADRDGSWRPVEVRS